MNEILFIAEIGNNHNGSLKRAKRLINLAKKAGCQVAKFQLRDFNSLYRGKGNSVEDLGVEYTKDLLQKYELPFEGHIELSKACEALGLEYMCTPWDLKSVDLLETLNVKRYKVASADFDNLLLIDRLIQTGKPLIFSTGMARTSEIKERIKYLDTKAIDYTLLHCNSTYPAPFEDIELNFITTLRKMTKSVGYSGHERGVAVSLGAIALGATIIERHITEDKDLEGPDHQASLLPIEFSNLIKMSKEIQVSLGDEIIDDRKLSQGTILNKEILGKSIVAARAIAKGEILTSECISIKSPGQGLPPSKLSKILGKEVNKSIALDEFILLKHFNKPKKIQTGFIFPEPNWGIPVRPHDVLKLNEIFDAPVYEFHISYKDLTRSLPDEDWGILSNKKILVHAPELFADSKLLDLSDLGNIHAHIKNLNSVCDFCRLIQQKIGTKQTILIIANIGGFSTHGFKSEHEKSILYNSIKNNLKLIDESDCEITLQNMAPFPWHFGGQRYQNIFAYPDEILRFCEETGRRITLDTAHLSMHCSFRDEDFLNSLKKLIQVTAHWHMSDAVGTNGEGVQMGVGDVDFNTVIDNVNCNQTFIVETWQGHKNDGEGFELDLKYLESIGRK